MPGVQHGQAGRVTPIHRPSDPPTQRPMCSQCSSMSDHALILDPTCSTGFSPLSYHRAQLATPHPCCCLLPRPFVPPGPSKELIRGRSLVSLCKVCGSLPGLPSAPSSSPPPVTHQALCLRPSKSHLHTCRASKRESAMPASPILSERHLLPAFCQRVADLSSLDFDT